MFKLNSRSIGSATETLELSPARQFRFFVLPALNLLVAVVGIITDFPISRTDFKMTILALFSVQVVWSALMFFAASYILKSPTLDNVMRRCGGTLGLLTVTWLQTVTAIALFFQLHRPWSNTETWFFVLVGICFCGTTIWAGQVINVAVQVDGIMKGKFRSMTGDSVSRTKDKVSLLLLPSLILATLLFDAFRIARVRPSMIGFRAYAVLTLVDLLIINLIMFISAIVIKQSGTAEVKFVRSAISLITISPLYFTTVVPLVIFQPHITKPFSTESSIFMLGIVALLLSFGWSWQVSRQLARVAKTLPDRQRLVSMFK